MNRRSALLAAGLSAAAVSTTPADAGRPTSSQTLRPGLGGMVRAADGAELFTTDWGAGRPVVFLSGLGLPSDMWDYQRAPMSRRGLRCVAYDRRGHGRSSIPNDGYGFDSLADDLDAVLAALSLRDVVLVGHSMAGGEIVRYLTRHAAGRVSKLVLVSTAATPGVLQSASNPNGPTKAQFEAYLDGVIAKDVAVWAEENAAPFFAPDTPAATRAWLTRMLTRTSLKAIYDCNQTMATADFAAELATIRLPTLVIHGDKDVSAPVERGRQTAALIPGARFVVYEGAPHGLFVTHRERLTADLQAFALS